MIEASGLSKHFDNALSLDGLNLTIAQGEKVAILGSNGAGKTTLMRLLLGLYQPTSGTIRVEGLDPFKERHRAIARLSFVPQLSPPLRLRVDELCDFATKTAATDMVRVRDITESMGMNLDAVRRRPFYKLSGGMRQKLMIALAFARDFSILLLDEPSSSIDPESRGVLERLLEEVKPEQSVVIISHRLEELRGSIHRAVTLDLGKVVRDEAL